jgi:hypothetical protein
MHSTSLTPLAIVVTLPLWLVLLVLTLAWLWYLITGVRY